MNSNCTVFLGCFAQKLWGRPTPQLIHRSATAIEGISSEFQTEADEFRCCSLGTELVGPASAIYRKSTSATRLNFALVGMPFEL